MTADIEPILQELALFADLGTDSPMSASSGTSQIVRMVRGGEQIELELQERGRGKVIARQADGSTDAHHSYNALLASDGFCDLRRWADVQATLLRQELEPEADIIRVSGVTAPNHDNVEVNEVDDRLASLSRPSESSVAILLLDGPAGIGKTHFIQQLALRRAANFKTTQRPLILHVQSRGRVLTFLQDLIAFSLDTLRLSLTYDQLPVLVRRGMVVLAIDGFDELGDPTGYDTAWSQVNELVDQVRQEGTLIFSGRETFIGRDRLYKDLKALRSDSDVVESLTLQPPEPDVARAWLQSKGWSTQNLDDVDELFESGSLALRPFFLRKLDDKEIAGSLKKHFTGNLIPFLVDNMIQREASKFGDVVSRSLDENARVAFVRKFLRETARDIAENQADAIDETSLAWIVEMALGDEVDGEIVALLKNRAAVMAFLATDARQNYRRFTHSQLYNYFLSEETVDTLTNQQVPKYIRRNILGADFLSTFCEFAYHLASTSPGKLESFIAASQELVHEYVSTDRGARNIGALLVSTLPVAEASNPRLVAIEIDEALIQGTAQNAELESVHISQLYAQNADLSALKFSNCRVVTLVVTPSTRVPPSMPKPALIEQITTDSRLENMILAPEDVQTWLNEHGGIPDSNISANDGPISAPVRNHGLFKLLGRACRYKNFWISFDELGSERSITADDHWKNLEELLTRHNLVRKEVKHPSGKPAEFLHIKRKEDLLDEKLDDPQIKDFFDELIAMATEG